MLRFNRKALRTRHAMAVLVLTLPALMSATAAAQELNFGAFTMMITEKEMKLEHPDEPMWDKYFNKDLPFQRMNDRNMPTIELMNDSQSTAPLTEFRLTIGDERFNFSDAAFGVFAKLANTTQGFSITSSTLNNEGDVLVVNIGNGGLAPGAMLRFKVDLAVDAAFANQFFAHPDYRTVLFDMNGLEVYSGFQDSDGSSDNATATATFDPAVGANFPAGPVALTDATVPGLPGGFFNNNYRQYGDLDPVRVYQLSAEVGVIPEPGSAVLALAGVVGGLLTGVRRHRFISRQA